MELLQAAGLRWSLIRHMTPVSVRELAAHVSARTAPVGTCRVESGPVWLDAVTTRIAASPEFCRDAKRRRWWRIAALLAERVEHQARPLTWITQAEIAAGVGCSTRTVSSCVAWLQREGLLHELVPGTRVPQASRPVDETPTEAGERFRRQQAQRPPASVVRRSPARRRGPAVDRAQIMAELAGVRTPEDTGQLVERERVLSLEHRRVRAALDAAEPHQVGALAAEADRVVAELDSVAAELAGASGASETARTAVWADSTPGEPAAEPAADEGAGEALLNIAPVYELRRALSTDEQADRDALETAHTRVPSSNAGEFPSGEVFFCPPDLSTSDHGSGCGGPVDNSDPLRGAQTTGGRDHHRSGAERAAARRTPTRGGVRSRSRDSRALRAAQRLIGELLDPMITAGVTVTWLAARLRGSGLLDADWSAQDVADEIHGLPEHSRLPRRIARPRAWVHARLAAASPALPPSKRAVIAEAEHIAATGARPAPVDRSRSEVRARRAVIAGCPLCDELGWLEIADPAVGAVRCSHDPDSGGW